MKKKKNRSDVEYLLHILIDMAFADGNMDPREENVIRRVASANNFEEQALQELIKNALHGKEPPEETFNELTYEARFDILYNLLVLMKADNIVMDEEIDFAQKIATKIGFQLSALMELYPHVHPNMKDPNQIRVMRIKLKQFFILPSNS